MNTLSHPLESASKARVYRAMILATASICLLGLFWGASRYAQLVGEVDHVGRTLPTMAWGSELVSADGAPGWQQIVFGAINWLDGMKIGMTFGVLLGALLYTYLKYYPLKLSNSYSLNSIKGALMGVPAAVCVNCAVPAACGVTRGNGRTEVAMGFMLSSPNLNPVVVTMTLVALPTVMTITKYVVLALLIVFAVPQIIAWLERRTPLDVFTSIQAGGAYGLSDGNRQRDDFLSVLDELGREYMRNVWMLLKPTLTIMLLASVLASAALVLLPWDALLAEVTPLRLLLVSLLSVCMPVPIALDVLFAAQLYAQGVAPGYVMLFAMTLGTYSIIPAVYLWREVSKPLSVLLLGFFVVTGVVCGLLF